MRLEYGPLVGHDAGTAITNRRHWGWAGTVRQFLDTPGEQVLSSLSDHHLDLMRASPSASQVGAWRDEVRILRSNLRDVTVAAPHATEWRIIFEYELPLEGGRRPDVVILAGKTLVVLEFKGDPRLDPAFVDQVSAYTRDLNEYHAESHSLRAVPMLVLTRATNPVSHEHVTIADPASIAPTLLDVESVGSVDLDTWLNSEYAPLPMLATAG